LVARSPWRDQPIPTYPALAPIGSLPSAAITTRRWAARILARPGGENRIAIGRCATVGGLWHASPWKLTMRPSTLDGSPHTDPITVADAAFDCKSDARTRNSIRRVPMQERFRAGKVVKCPVYRGFTGAGGLTFRLVHGGDAVHINATAAAGYPSLPLCPNLRRDRGRSAARRGGQQHVLWPACRCNGPRLWRSPEQVEFVRSLPQEQPCQSGGGDHVGDPDVVGGIVFDKAISRAFVTPVGEVFVDSPLVTASQQ
jgi:hypothetical protein